MASGSFNVSTDNTYIKGNVSWSSTENVSANTSSVTATLILERTNTGYTTSGSGTFYLEINGVDISDSLSYSLSYNSNTVMVRGTVTVPHNADGTKSITISSWGSGSTFSLAKHSGTAKLDTIPRASNQTTDANWTAGANKSVSISRASSSFTHTVKVYVNGVLIKTVTGVTTSTTVAFSTPENTSIFNQLNGAATQDTKIEILTYNGSTLVGTTSKTGTVTAPNASTLNFTGNPDYTIGNAVTFGMTRYNSLFTHTLKVYIGTTLIKQIDDVDTSFAWTPTASEISTMYNATPNANEIDGNIEVYTYFNGELVRGVTHNDIDFLVKNSNPTFGTGYTYIDTNTVTTGLTGDAKKIVQNKSTITVTLPSTAKATAINGATMTEYIATLAGVQRTATYSSTADLTFVFGIINANTDQILTIKAVDSRGNSTQTTITVTMIPYTIPTINASVKRDGGFANTTKLNMNGVISLLTIGGVNKNAVQSVQYRYKKVTDTTAPTWDSWASFVYTTSGQNYTANVVSLDLDNTLSWHIEFKITDKLGNVSSLQTVISGKPLWFVDSKLKSIGFNKFPIAINTFELDGHIDATGKVTANELHAKATLTVKPLSGTANAAVELGGTTGASTPFIDFHSGATASDYDSRIVASGGNGSSAGGNLNLHTALLTHNSKPISAIDSQGSNTNGTYIRYTDGTQICWIYIEPTDQAINNAYGSLFQNTRVWTYPSAFINNPSVQCSMFKWGTGAGWGTVSLLDTSTCELRGIDILSRATGTAVRISAMAIGRWK